MEILRHIIVFVHLVGFAVLLGSWAVAAFGGNRRFTGLMTVGMTIAAVAGLILASPLGLPEGASLNYTKIAVKLVILLIIGALLGIGGARQKRTGELAPALFWLVGILTAANAAIAVLW